MSEARQNEVLLSMWEDRCRRGEEIAAAELGRAFRELTPEQERRLAVVRELSGLIRKLRASDSAPAVPAESLGAGAEDASPSGHGSASPRPGEFFSGDYEIVGELGRGGMGVVYRAYDCRNNRFVALKTMREPDSAALHRFKREFRALSDVSHSNLVTLYELASNGRDWFFTMELVDGIDFLRYVRSDAKADDAETTVEPRHSEDLGPILLMPKTAVTRDHRSDALGDGPAIASAAIPATSERSPFQLARLRGTLRQLAEGVSALHGAGWLHRDLKPSNVLVTRSGRVVLLDFGLTAEMGSDGLHQSTESHLLGTAAYMSPEQAAGMPVTPAGDWYSVGVMLYEALTGRLPFSGRMLEVLMDKQRFQPPSPRQLAADVPEDLDILCADLLRREPQARPSGHDVLRRLGGGSSAQVSNAQRSSSKPSAALIGRKEHLKALAEAYEVMKRGGTSLLLAHGPSGAGKSTLIREFLDRLPEDDQAVVLAGRCYEREAVPYKALDGVVDALSKHLRRLPAADVRAVLPSDLPLLAQVFPVLRHAEGISTTRHRERAIPDPQEVRRRAVAALRELLIRLGNLWPLVLVIDDLQWGDRDSALLLSDLLSPPNPPALLLVGSYRREDEATSPFLGEFLGAAEVPGVSRRKLPVDELTQAEAEDLARELLGRDSWALTPEVHSAAVARESGGNPFFIGELVRHIQSGLEQASPSSQGGEIRLDDVIWDRIQRLPDEARRLLEVIAVFGRPIEQAMACQVAEVVGDGPAALGVLRVGRLVRGTGTREEQSRIEPYHDRVRETILAYLAPEAIQDCHSRLASALEAAGYLDQEVLAIHWQGAGQSDKAAAYYAQAGDHAARSLAFDRATKLYRLALNLWEDRGISERRLQTNLADALANCGRGSEAARCYLAATAGANVAESLELRRRAAMQLLISGHLDEGIAVLREVLTTVGMRLPSTPRRALMSLLWRRARIQYRGLSFRLRDPSQVSPEALTRLDVCWSVAIGLGVADWIRGADFQARALLLSLKTGVPYHIARSLALEAAHIAAAGNATLPRVNKLLQTADQLAASIQHPNVFGTIHLARGIVNNLVGEWKKSYEFSKSAEEVFREQCSGVAWEVGTAQAFGLWALAYMGEIAELGKRWTVLIKEARDKGDQFAEANLDTDLMALFKVASDEPGEARSELERIMARWSLDGFHIQHHNGVLARAHIELYEGVT